MGDPHAVRPGGGLAHPVAEYVPPHEMPNEDFPFSLITGRTLYQFHTRTKTGRAPQLQAAAPDVWVEMSVGDADRMRAREGDLLEVRTPRGSVRARLRISGIRDGVLFLPFHYGYWDDGHRGGRAANELTLTD
ncbi:molybdopterin dinucleotide binding domain-containing protein [Geodermatophilus chilensis]|uniref:molybdopterin dinucleotide binding domain-containing protein n=1 Tax=Geodermatophilus chilensis TaxID=2035835 RepID=UPI0018E411AD|nr:molybdopterin dinucleotide binding domain-containing protein [Geodermatophilus chilensis]